MTFYHDDLLELIDHFEKAKVQYLIIGGFAANKYGYNRFTGDLDLFLFERFY